MTLIPTTRIPMVASAARTASGTGSAFGDNQDSLADYTSATFMLDVTADESTSADLLDVLVQRLLPDLSTWDTIGRFEQLGGDNGADKYVLDISNGSADNIGRDVDDNVTAAASVTLSANAVRDVAWGEQVRIAWIINDDSTSASFTFSVDAFFRI
jgi:hypothetical protein